VSAFAYWKKGGAQIGYSIRIRLGTTFLGIPARSAIDDITLSAGYNINTGEPQVSTPAQTYVYGPSLAENREHNHYTVADDTETFFGRFVQKKFVDERVDVFEQWLTAEGLPYSYEAWNELGLAKLLECMNFDAAHSTWTVPDRAAFETQLAQKLAAIPVQVDREAAALEAYLKQNAAQQ
jgi:hypothetical protein